MVLMFSTSIPWRRVSWLFVLYVVFGLWWRCWNVWHSTYFIYDQGRDAWAFQEILSGDLTLVGPSSGLAGFYLGPLWFYAGVPGAILGGGSPYIINLWYILLASCAIPGFWWLAHRLFGNTWMAKLIAVVLLVVTGSLQGSIFVWNPLLAIPLLVFTLFAFDQLHDETKKDLWRWGWLGAGFLSLALILQSEFAYAIFLVPPFFLLVPWLMKRWQWKDFMVAGMAIGVTLVPQMLFELVHRFVMTNALLTSIQDPSRTITWAELWEIRPFQLWAANRELLVGPGQKPDWVVSLLRWSVVLGAAVVASFWFRRPKDMTLGQQKLWKIISIIFILPYMGFMAWRGNLGVFFGYYLTSHFIVLIPILSAPLLLAKAWGNRVLQVAVGLWVAVLFTTILAYGWSHWNTVVWEADGQGALWKMDQAVERLLSWTEADQQAQPTIKVFTPNVYTEQYDYIMWWRTQRLGRPTPLTVRNGKEQQWYLLLESTRSAEKKIYGDWYREATTGGKLVRQEIVGAMVLEKYEAVSTPAGELR
jgi:hypothetical protein